MRKTLTFAALLVLLGLLSVELIAKAKPYMAPRAFHAKTYPAHETHDNEKISLAADPYDMPDKVAGVFSVNYQSNGLLPIYLIFSNDGDRPVSLGKMRVTLVTRRQIKIDPSSPDDIYRRLARQTSRGDEPSRFPLPRKKNTGVTDQVREEVESSQFLARAVEPHVNQAGFLYFDVRGIDNPLAGAKLVVTGLTDSDGNELFYFEIPMEKYLGYQPVK
jgi:hypothetical protein